MDLGITSLADLAFPEVNTSFITALKYYDNYWKSPYLTGVNEFIGYEVGGWGSQVQRYSPAKE